MKGDGNGRHDDEILLMDHREIVIQAEHEADGRSDERKRVRFVAPEVVCSAAQERDGYPAPEKKDGEKPMRCCKCG